MVSRGCPGGSGTPAWIQYGDGLRLTEEYPDTGMQKLCISAQKRTSDKRVPKTVLKLPDLEQSKSAALNSLTSASSKRSYDHAIREFIDWYCSEPRLAFDRY